MRFSKSPRVPACSSILNIFISTNTAVKYSDGCTELKWLVKKKPQFDFVCSLSLMWQYFLTLPRRNNLSCYYLPVNSLTALGFFFPPPFFSYLCVTFLLISVISSPIWTLIISLSTDEVCLKYFVLLIVKRSGKQLLELMDTH